MFSHSASGIGDPLSTPRPEGSKFRFTRQKYFIKSLGRRTRFHIGSNLFYELTDSFLRSERGDVDNDKGHVVARLIYRDLSACQCSRQEFDEKGKSKASVAGFAAKGKDGALRWTEEIRWICTGHTERINNPPLG